MTKLIQRNKRKAALFLVMLFTMFCFLSYKQEAKAIAIVDDIILWAAILMLSAAGLTFSTDAAAESTAGEFVDEIGVEAIAASAGIVFDYATNKFKFIAGITPVLWGLTKDWVDENYDVGVQMQEAIENLNNSGSLIRTRPYYYYAYIPMWGRYEAYYSSIPFVIQNISGIDYIVKPSGCYYDMYMKPDGGYWSVAVNNSTSYFQILPSEIQGANYTLGAYSPPTGIVGVDGVVDNPTYDWYNQSLLEKAVGFEVTQTQDIENADISVLTPSGTAIGFDVPAGVVEGISTKTIPEILDEDLTGVQVGTIDNVYTDEITDALPVEMMPTQAQENSIKALVISKFPFCIPWDIKNVIALIASQPEAPNFELDLLAPIGRSGLAVIDFDMADYEIVGQVFRWVSTVEFVLLLAVGTKKLLWTA